MPKMTDFCPQAHEALRERNITEAQLEHMSPREILDEVLNWEGISGYTGLIIRTLRAAGATIPGSE